MNRAFVLAGALCFTVLANAAAGDWVAGTNYLVLKTPVKANVAKGKVEVLEFFWYGCGHCYALDPALETWKAAKPEYVEFSRVHVMWSPLQQQHAKLFYTLQALGRPDLHPKVFAAIHEERNLLAAQDVAAARALHKAFFEKHGVTAKDFDAAYDSAAVAANLKRAEEATLRFAVESVPMMAINGAYTTTVNQAGGASQLLTLVNDLAAREHAR